MVTDWIYHLGSPLRAARRAAIPLGLLVVFGYLVLNGSLYHNKIYTPKAQQAFHILRQ